MKHFFIAFLFAILSATISLQAQDYLPLGVQFSTGKSYFTSTSIDFENFRLSLNDLYGTELTKEMAPFSFENSTFYSVGFAGSAFEINYIWNTHEGYTEAKYKNGGTREIRFVDKSSQIEFGFCFPFNYYGSFGPTFGVVLHNTNIYSGYRYPSGELSYGIDKSLNGIYTGGGSDFILGLKGKVGYKYGFISIRYNWYGMFYKRNSYNHVLGMQDPLDGGSPYYQNYNFPVYLADDVKNVGNTNVSTIGLNGQFVGEHFKGHYFQIGLTVFLGWYFDND